MKSVKVNKTVGSSPRLTVPIVPHAFSVRTSSVDGGSLSPDRRARLAYH